MPELNSFHLDAREGIKKQGQGRDGWGGGVLDTPHCPSQPSISSCFLSGHYIRSDFFSTLERVFFSMVLPTDSAIMGQTAQCLDGLTDGLQIYMPECLLSSTLSILGTPGFFLGYRRYWVPT